MALNETGVGTNERFSTFKLPKTGCKFSQASRSPVKKLDRLSVKARNNLETTVEHMSYQDLIIGYVISLTTC